jgi:probable rRNA maturation factor
LEIGNWQLAMIEVINRQRRRKINAKQWLEFLERAIRALPTEKREATVVFVSDAAIRKLNREFRGRDYATDVLSFPAQAEPFETEAQFHLGEVVISVERAEEQARKNNVRLENEIQQLILHGLLHLCGYDHETDTGEMNRLELKLRKKLRI